MNHPAGMGCQAAAFKVYIANRPPLPEFEALVGMHPLAAGEVGDIVARTSNHWRKIFNLYAKLGFALKPNGFDRWQDYRDNVLLGADSGQALMFSAPNLSEGCLHLIAGHTYAKALGVDEGVEWVDESFAVDRHRRLVIGPYLDYRQLSNVRLDQLVSILRTL